MLVVATFLINPRVGRQDAACRTGSCPRAWVPTGFSTILYTREGLNKAGFGLRGAYSVRAGKAGSRSTGAAVAFRVEREG